jgi:hypothetical protein
MNYLKAAQAVHSTDADKVMDYLKKTKLEDFYAKGYIRADGRYVHDVYLVQVKSPTESKAPWDYVKVIATMPGEELRHDQRFAVSHVGQHGREAGARCSSPGIPRVRRQRLQPATQTPTGHPPQDDRSSIGVWRAGIGGSAALI